ncbi:MAG: hypothetical protein O2992_11300 [Gemmatimonadetes bacterium]|jgi:hypothetical protein|nr:hypothetical protein [Gemmatimonadota bacterium]
MPRVSFDELPGHGQLWVFPATSELSDEQSARFMEAVDGFLDVWAAHGVPLTSARELRDNRFVLIGVDLDAEAPSGCSIDALVNQLKGLGSELGVSLIDHSPVWFRDGDEIHSVGRSEFRRLAGEESVAPDTTVFDTTLTRIASLRAGLLERPASETWHGRAFFREKLGA